MVGTNSADKVLGATDPTSGTASVHEVVKGLGALVKSGWKPLRTILIASWDAEEVCVKFGYSELSLIISYPLSLE